MLLTALVFGLTPTRTHHVESSEFLSPVQPRSDVFERNGLDTRTISEIVYSCLCTLFLATIYCIRPNIPPANASRLQVALRKLNIIAWFFLSPELIVSWAIYQRQDRKRVLQKYKNRGWTSVHAHFVGMGGLVLYKDGMPFEVLSPEAFTNLLHAGCIEFPLISVEDIQLRSSAHPALTAFVTSQVLWFVIQCVSRLASKLVITQLEVITLAFLVANGSLRLLWWNKPLDVRRTVRIDLLQPIPAGLLNHGPAIQHGTTRDFLRELSTRNDAETFLSADTLARINESRHPTTPRSLDQVFLLTIHRIILQYAALLLRRMVDHISEEEISVPLFYASDSNNRGPYFVFTMNLLGSIFAGSHLTMWHSHFATPRDSLVWRITAFITLIYPIVMIFAIPVLVVVVASFISQRNNAVTAHKVVQRIGYCLLLLGFSVLVACRLALLVEAFLALTSLPATALRVVPWRNYIPHLS